MRAYYTKPGRGFKSLITDGRNEELKTYMSQCSSSITCNVHSLAVNH